MAGALQDYLKERNQGTPAPPQSALSDYLAEKRRDEEVRSPLPPPAPEPEAAEQPEVEQGRDTPEEEQGALASFLRERDNVVPAKTPPPPVDPSQVPGFGSLFGQTISAGYAEMTRKDALLREAVRSKLMGGPFFPQQVPPEPPIPPAVKEQLDKPFSLDNYYDPRWLMTNLVYGGMSSALPLAAGVAGGAIGGLPGGAAGFGLTSGLSTVIPKFQEAQRSGLKPDEAAALAIKQAAIESGAGAAGWAAFGMPLFGTIAREHAGEVIGTALKHPTLEVLTQLGLVQPTIGTAGAYGEKAVAGKDYTPSDAFHDYLANMAFGGLTVGAFHGAGWLGARLKQEVVNRFPGPPATEEELRALHAELVRNGQVVPPYTKISEMVDRFEGDKRPASEWMEEFRSVLPDHYIDGLIPKWAADENGIVTKANLTEAIRSQFLEESFHEDVDANTGELIGTVGLWEPKPEDPAATTPVAQLGYIPEVDVNGRNSSYVHSNGWGPKESDWRPSDAFRFLRFFADHNTARITFDEDEVWGNRFLEAAKKLGLDTGFVPDRNLAGTTIKQKYIDLDARASSNPPGLPPEQMGKPLISNVRVVEPPSYKKFKYTPGELRPAARKLGEIVKSWVRGLGITRDITIKLHDGPIPGTNVNNLGLHEWTGMGRSEISIAVGSHADAAELYTTMAHEFGHALFYHMVEKLGPNEVAQIMAMKSQFADAATEAAFRKSLPYDVLQALDADHKAYVKQLQDFRTAGATVLSGVSIRDPGTSYYQTEQRVKGGLTPEKLSNLSQKQWNYWTSLNEFIANQVSKWASTAEKPLSQLDREFSALAKQIRQVHEYLEQARHGNLNFVKGHFDPGTGVQRWMDDFLKQNQPFSTQGIISQGQLDAQAANRAAEIIAGASGNGAVPFTVASGGGRGIMSRIGSGLFGRSYAASADKMNKFFEWMISIPQLAEINSHIRGLVLYNDLLGTHHLNINTTQNRFLETMQAWKKLGQLQGDNLTDLIYAYKHQLFRTPAEVKKGVLRMPTLTEMTDMARQYKVTSAGLAVFKRIQDDLAYARDRTAESERIQARKISDPVRQQQVLDDIDAKYRKMASVPYFPETRFGDYTFTIFDAAGRKVRFETAENSKGLDRIEAEFHKTKLPGETGLRGKMSPESAPFFGLPPALLKAMEDNLSLTAAQKAQFEEFKLAYAPTNSFANRFQKQGRVPGWSMDFRRTFANYGFAYSRWQANLEYVPLMQNMIADVRNSAKSLAAVNDVINAEKRYDIATHMSNHFKQLMNPAQDYAVIRAALFHMYLGFSPASATLNLTQTLMGTLPRLADEFGNLKATGALLKATSNLSTFYRKGTLGSMTDRDMRAMSELVREGVIAEGQATQLGGMTNYDNLTHNVAKGALQATMRTMAEWSGKMFDMTEQYNRRVAARAAFQLALDNPTANIVTRSRQMQPLQYQRLVDRGWSEAEASAIVTAKAMVEGTQYVYSPFARPKFMWGKKGTLFAFKSFTQNTLFMLGNYPGTRLRSLLILGTLGGMMGLPGAEDISGLIKGIAYRVFGKDFDIDDITRKFAIDILDGKVDPDIMLHGLSRHGFGIPQIMDMMGLNMGLRSAYPTEPGKLWRGFDRSASIGMGRVAPFDIGQLLGPNKDMNLPQVEAMQQALGAGFGYTFALYKALFASRYDLSDFKRWEQLMPRFLSNASHAYRYYSEGQERTTRGNPILRFDPTEPMHMVEIIGKAMGYNPARITEQYDNMRADAEAKAYWTSTQQSLLNQFWHTVQTKDEVAREKVVGAIKRFNLSLPDEARAYALGPDQIEKSMRARAVAAGKAAAGIPQAKKDIPLSREVRRLHPGASIVGQQRVQ
jgi:hypothetical protein